MSGVWDRINTDDFAWNVPPFRLSGFVPQSVGTIFLQQRESCHYSNVIFLYCSEWIRTRFA